MNILDIKKGVVDLWQFAWPPIVFLLLASGTLRKWFPNQWDWLMAFFNRHFGDDHKKNRLRNFLNSIGASKVYPVALFVLMILMLQVINEFILFCDTLPPGLGFQPVKLAQRYTMQPEKFYLSALYPEAPDFDSAYYAASSEFGSSMQMSDRSKFYHTIQSIAKSVAYGSLMLLMLTMVRPKLRSFFGAFIVILIATAIWCVCLIPVVREAESAWNGFNQKLIAEARRIARTQSIKLPMDRPDLLSEPIYTKDPGPWWDIMFTRGDEWRWFRREFLREEEK